MNELLRTHHTLRQPYQEIKIRVVQLSGEGLENLDYPSKFDRSPALIEQLLAGGAKKAGCFFDDDYLWSRRESIPARSVVYKA